MIYITDHQALSVNEFKFFGEYDDSEFTVVIELHKTDSGMEYEIENNLGLDEAELMAAVSKYMEKFWGTGGKKILRHGGRVILL